MNVQIENLGPCKKLVRVEVEVPEVEKAFEDKTRDFVREAKLPGFRPGKAPRQMVVKRYEKQIADEVKRKLTADSYQKAIKDNNLHVYAVLDVEDIQFSRGQPMLFAARVDTLPEFELPEYKKLPAKRDDSAVTEADVEGALEMLREQKAKYEKVERPLATGDVAVVNYSGTCDGQPISTLAPDAKGVAQNSNFWMLADKSTFVPGFMDQLLGTQAGDQRSVAVEFPAKFLVPELAGKKGVYEVELLEVKQKVLPAVDDDLAKLYEAASLDEMRKGVRRDLENEKSYQKRKNVRDQVVQALLDRVNFELPETAVAAETKHVVYDIVAENTRRGITRDQLQQSKDQIYSVANNSARERVKAAFLFGRIAEKENIKITQDELSRRIYGMAAEYKMPVESFVKELEKRNGLQEIHQQLLTEKVVDFLADNAEIVDVPASPAPSAPA